MPSLEDLLNEVDLHEQVLKNNLLYICLKYENKFKEDMRPFIPHLNKDFPSFVSLWNILGSGFSKRDFESGIHNLINEMVIGYKKGNHNLYKVLIKLNNKYSN